MLASIVQAHSFNESYVYFDVSETTLGGKIEVTVTELAKVLSGDGSASTPLTQDAVQENFDTFAAYFQDNMNLSKDGQPYEIDFTSVTFLETTPGLFAQFNFEVLDVTDTPVTIEMSYTPLFNDIDKSHRGYGLIATNTRNGMEENEGYISLFFGPGDGMQTLYLNDERSLDTALTFVEHGIWHIWLGIDHVLFLLTLLIASVMVIQQGRWEPSTGLRQSLKETIKIVTVFTLAHTITLCLATLGIITLPVVFVEAVIALSIAIVALGNLFPRMHVRSWILVFAFGLFHGFGFANVLEPLGLDPTRKAIGLVAFNIGVELGQLAIVLVVFPILYALRQSAIYRPIAMQFGSVALIAIAIFWFYERTYDVFAPYTAAWFGG